MFDRLLGRQPKPDDTDEPLPPATPDTPRRRINASVDRVESGFHTAMSGLGGLFSGGRQAQQRICPNPICQAGNEVGSTRCAKCGQVLA